MREGALFTLRFAEASDAQQVVRLMEAMHTELHQRFRGSIIAGEKTRLWLRGCFDRALHGEGACLIMDNELGRLAGVSLAVESALPYDSIYQKAALGIGTYVVPDQRKHHVASALYANMARVLYARGFDSYLGGTLAGNHAAEHVTAKAGFEPTETGVVLRLRGGA